MLENLQDAISGLEFEKVLQTVMFYYTLVFLVVGGVLLCVTLYRLVRLYQGTRQTMTIVFFTTYSIVQLYLAIAMIIPYFQMVLSRMNDHSFWFPFNTLYQFSLKLHDTILFQLVGLVVIGGLMLVSIVFLLSGLAKLLSSKPNRLFGGDNLTVSLVVSYVPIILFIGTL